MELTKLDEVIKLLKKAESYLYRQEKLYIFIGGKSYIIHNVNQKSYDYLSKVSGINTPREARKYTRIKGEKWTPEEEEIVLRNPKLGILEVLLPHRTKDAIRHKLHQMKTKGCGL